MDVTHLLATLVREVPQRLQSQFVEQVVASPWFYASFAGVLLLEWIAAAKVQQRSFTGGLRHDILWTVIGFPLGVATVTICLFTSREIYLAYFSFLTIDAVQQWSRPARVLLALVVVDFAKWFTHLARHRIPWLWPFHAVHHSQKELNFLSDFRIHPGDHAADMLIRSLPVCIVDQSFETIAIVEWLRYTQARLYHANIRSNFGILRYVFVTPQSHRIHHSIDPRHAHKNFGAMLSVWDYLFGTQYRRYDEYPDTGIVDGRFAFEQDCRARGALRCFWEQLVYPLQALRSSDARAVPPQRSALARQRHEQ